jgi:NADPH:quinone reductase-like Zn-dependent oxidoreductase
MKIASNTASLGYAVLLSVVATPAAFAADQIRHYELERAESGYRLVLRAVARPTPAANEVLVRIRAVSLNHRDLYVLEGSEARDVTGIVPLSDGAGEVIAVGQGVRRFKAGDRVATTFFE